MFVIICTSCIWQFYTRAMQILCREVSIIQLTKNSTIVTFLVFFILISPLFTNGVDATSLLKKGSSGGDIKTVQQKLKQLGYFNEETTGYFGTVTEKAVIAFQSASGLEADGIIGPMTLRTINKATTVDVSRSTSTNRGALLKWFGQAEDAFPIGAVATITDITTGLQFIAKRTYGYNHADCEPATAEDTKIYKSIFDGEYKWEMRSIILEYDGQKLAASMAGMPHAGRDDKPSNAWVSGRSSGYGYGYNLDAVKGNNMSGHFDIHFLGSKTHGSNKVDNRHQEKILEAAKYIK